MIPGSGRSAGEGRSYPLQYSWASLMVQLVKNLPAMQETLGSIPGSGRSLGKGKVYLLQYSGLENSMGPWGHKESKTTERLSLSFTLLPDGSVSCFHVLVHRIPPIPEKWASLSPLSLMRKLRLRKSKLSV